LFYNLTGFTPGFSRSVIKTESIFSAIREINEILSLTNEPDKLVNTALDSLSQILNIECCWIQTISDRKNQLLTLAADRGLSDSMRAEITGMSLKDDFAGQIIGMGNKIIIPDLNDDGAYGLGSFRAAGYKWLVAVPLMNYRAYGLLGTASKIRKIFDKETPELIMVIAGLIANALSKTYLNGSFQKRYKPLELATTVLEKETPEPDSRTEIAPETMAVNIQPPEPEGVPPGPEIEPLNASPVVSREKPVKSNDPAFKSHTRKMESFRKMHG